MIQITNNLINCLKNRIANCIKAVKAPASANYSTSGYTPHVDAMGGAYTR